MIIFIREGSNKYNHILFTLDTDTGYVRAGNSSILGEVLFNIKDGRIRAGSSPWGSVIARIDGKYIREGDGPFGTIKYNIDGDYIRSGDGLFSRIVANMTTI